MITVTLGTIAYPFDRAISWIEELIEEEVFCEPIFLQHGVSSAASIEKHPLVTALPTLPQDMLNEWIGRSRLVIAHAGQGTTRMLIEGEANFVLLPRLSKHGEHVDNHQLAFAQSVQNLGVRYCVSKPHLRAVSLAPPRVVETQFFNGPKLSNHLLEKYPAYRPQVSHLEPA